MHTDEMPVKVQDMKCGEVLGLGVFAVKILSVGGNRVRLGIGRTDGHKVKLGKPVSHREGLTYVAKMGTMR